MAYVTHDQSEALAVSDQIIVMDHGIIAQRGTPRELYEYPTSEFVAGFMGEAMLFDAVVDTDGVARIGPMPLPTRWPDSAGQTVRVAVRPEAWCLEPAASPQNLAGRITKHAYLGSVEELTVETAIGHLFVLTAADHQPRADGDPPRAVGIHRERWVMRCGCRCGRWARIVWVFRASGIPNTTLPQGQGGGVSWF